nr:hypothetical protein [Tanacetum cinerariifolium]
MSEWRGDIDDNLKNHVEDAIQQTTKLNDSTPRNSRDLDVYADSAGSFVHAKEVDNDSKELKDKIEALNEELLIETRGAAEATLEHLPQNNLEQQVKESDEKKSKLDSKLNQLHKRAKQQIQENEHYALWEVIEFGDSYKAPPDKSGKGPASESSTKKNGRIVIITTEDMQKRRNDVKARTTLLFALPDDHQLRFSKYETAKELWEDILKTFETLEQTFNKLQAIISHLEFMDVEIEQNDLNQKFLTSLAPEWLIECRAPRSQDRGKRESYKQGPKEEEPAPKALIAIDSIGWDWSYMANEEENHALVADDEVPTEFALMAKSSSSSEYKVYDDSYCSKSCLPEFVDDIVTDYSRPTPSIDTLKSDTSDLQSSNFSIYELGESSCSIMSKPMIKFVNAADRPRVTKTNNIENARKSTIKYAKMYRNTSKCPKVRGNKGKVVKALACWIWTPKQNTTKQGPNCNGVSVTFKKYQYIDTQGRLKYWDSCCSRHMTGNISYLSEYKPYNGAYVSFGQGGGKITSKGIIKTDVASQAVKKNMSSLRYIALLNWLPEAHIETRNSDSCNADEPKSSRISNSTATSKVPSVKQMEPVVSLTVETEIPTFSSPVPTVCLDISSEISSDIIIISKGDFSQKETPSVGNALTLSNKFEDTFGEEADLSNMKTSIPFSPISTFRIHKDHPKIQIIGPVDTPVQTRHKSKEMEEQSFIAIIHQKTNPDLLKFCLFLCFLSQEEPKKIFDALKDPSWVEAMQEELLHFKIHNVWILVDCPKGEEGIDYKEVFAPVTMIEAIRLFLAYASFMGFIVYQMDVKSAFLYGTIDEEAPRAWYGTLSKYLLDNGFQRGTIDQTLFIRKHKGEFLLVQVYVDDIIFGSSNPQLCKEFEALMHEKFQMSAIGELTFFLGLQVLKKKDGIFLSQDKVIFSKSLDTQISMIGSLMYLTASRPDVMFAVCAYARHQVTPKGCHLHAVKRIFRYLKGHPKLGLWYPKDFPFDLVAYSDSDYGGATQDRKSTTGGC